MDGGYFDPDTIQKLKRILDDVWGSLPAQKQAETSRSVLAERLLKAAAAGERDPIRLRARALVEVVAG